MLADSLAHLKGHTLLNPFAEAKQALVGPNEDGLPLLALDVSVESRGHGCLGCLAGALDETPLECRSRNLACGVGGTHKARESMFSGEQNTSAGKDKEESTWDLKLRRH